jgi:UDP-2,3-diacylglucosamine pyrophosphatase LpxH
MSDTFTSLHVVSDLHLGGSPAGRQIFDQGAAFTDLIDQLLHLPADETHALLINGDLVDFLADPKAVYFDTLTAIDKLNNIFTDPAFVPVWDGLKKLVKTPNRPLIITLGNHDLELSLPPVRRRLLDELSGGGDAARGRITLAFEQEGYRARVGRTDVLCVHGNEVDIWNVTDYEQLRRLGRDVDRGVSSPAWVPNAGTRLVIDVMNGIKQKHALVDLLKPERQAVLPTLLVLDAASAPKVADAVPSVLRLGWDRVRRAFGFLGVEDGAAPVGAGGRPSAALMLGAMLQETFQSAVPSGARPPTGRDLLRATEQHFRNGVLPRQLLAATPQPELLSVGGMIMDIFHRKGRAEVLREALERVRQDTSFDIHEPDATFKALRDRIPPGIPFLTAGHTHLERALKLGTNRYYFNSGTWVRLIELRPEVLGSDAAFKPVYDAIEQGSMADLDAAPNLVLRRPSVVRFVAGDRGTTGALCRVAGGRLDVVEGFDPVEA